MTAQNQPLHPETEVVLRGRPEREPGGAIIGGISVSTTFRAGGEYIYGRSDNDTWKDLEAVLGALEAGRALVFSSGMSAISATFDLLPPKGVIVAPSSGYMNTSVQLRKLEANGRLIIRWVDITDTFDLKMAALHAHASQTAHNKELENMVREWGQRNAGIGGLPEGRIAEAFKIVHTN